METGLYYLNSRYYDPEIGRFISADEIVAGIGGEINGYNLYIYCFNNPINMDDVDGNWPKWVKTLAYAVTNAVKTVIAPFMGLDFKIGVGTGFRASANLGDSEISGGFKADLLTFTSNVDNSDIGQEFSAGVSITLLEVVECGVEEGQFNSWITNETTKYNFNEPQIAVNIVGLELYCIVGATVNISYNFERVAEEYIEIWEFYN